MVLKLFAAFSVGYLIIQIVVFACLVKYHKDIKECGELVIGVDFHLASTILSLLAGFAAIFVFFIIYSMR